MKIPSAIIGGILLVAGVVGSGSGVFALIDPRGSKMADDGDPFGPAPGVVESSLILGVYLVVTAVGVYLLWRSLRKPPVSTKSGAQKSSG